MPGIRESGVCGRDVIQQHLRGTVLLEILLAIGLLGVVTACLLTTFQRARQVKSHLTQDLQWLNDTSRMLEFLQRDLRQARGLLPEDLDQRPGSAITMEMNVGNSADTAGFDQGARVRYSWDHAREALVRTVSESGSVPTSATLLRWGQPSFEALVSADAAYDSGSDSMDADPALMQPGQNIRAIRIRFSETAGDAALEPGAPEQAYTIYLPLPLRVLSAEDVYP